MKNCTKFLVAFAIVCFFSCNNEPITETQEIEAHSLRSKIKKHENNCLSEVTIEILDCGVYQINSSKDLSNIVYRVDGVDTKIEFFSGPSFMLVAENTTDIWVKSGCNHSGDGPGYGEHFAVDDSEFCDGNPPIEQCTTDLECENGRCGEGGYCTGAVGGRVFIDTNGDGLFNNGESGTVAGVFLQILVVAGWVDFSFEVTDTEGNYLFTAINANPPESFNYRVRFIPPPGTTFTYTLQNVGDDDTIDSDVNSLGISDAVIPLPDEIITTLWAGVLPE